MTALDTVFLDAGGVLVHPDWWRVGQVLARRGLRWRPGAASRAELEVARAMDTPDVIGRTADADRVGPWLREVLTRCDVPPHRDLVDELVALHARDNLWSHLPDEVPTALVRLRDAGLRLVVVSNANGTVRGLLERLGVGALVELVVDSGEEGVEKPDPRLFAVALERAGARAERTVHVGDLFHVDVLGARAAGIRAVLLDKLGTSSWPCPTFSSLTAFADAVTEGDLSCL